MDRAPRAHERRRGRCFAVRTHMGAGHEAAQRGPSTASTTSRSAYAFASGRVRVGLEGRRFVKLSSPLAPHLRGEGGVRALSANSVRSDNLTPSPGSQERSDLSPQAGRG